MTSLLHLSSETSFSCFHIWPTSLFYYTKLYDFRTEGHQELINGLYRNILNSRCTNIIKWRFTQLRIDTFVSIDCLKIFRKNIRQIRSQLALFILKNNKGCNSFPLCLLLTNFQNCFIFFDLLRDHFTSIIPFTDIHHCHWREGKIKVTKKQYRNFWHLLFFEISLSNLGEKNT